MHKMSTIQTIDKRQSSVITAMRFPLIVLVLVAHSAGATVDSFHWPLDGGGGYAFFSEMVSRHLCSIAVCWFYTFSGYYFFRNLQEGEFGWRWLQKKWKNRIHTLLVPYVIWNLIVVISSLLLAKLYDMLGIVPTVDPMGVVERGPLDWLVTGPADFPLYFMRDLMLMSLFAPVFYVLEKRFPVLSLTFLAFFYFSCWSPAIPHYRAVFYFGLGAWFGIHKRNILSICRKVRIPAALLALILLPTATALTGHPIHELIRRLFFPFGMITMMNLCDRWIDNERVATRLTALASSVFFIFAAHEVFILGWVKGAFLRVLGNSLTGMWVSYLFTPVVVLTICLIFYSVLKKITPKTLAFICGGRVIS